MAEIVLSIGTSHSSMLCTDPDPLAASAITGNLDFNLIDCIPYYRSPAGTGCGIDFAHWS